MTQGQTPGAAPPPLDTGCFFLPHTNKTAALMHSLRRQALSLLGASEQVSETERRVWAWHQLLSAATLGTAFREGLGMAVTSLWNSARSQPGGDLLSGLSMVHERA